MLLLRLKPKWASAISNPWIENPIPITKKAHWAKLFGFPRFGLLVGSSPGLGLGSKREG